MRKISGDNWLGSKAKKIILFGMSGLGKTHISNMLRETKDWYHYSVDYRIGTRYLGEAIDDNLKAEAMKVPVLREQLLSDSIFIKSNISFNNLAPVSYFLGKPGNEALGGLSIETYKDRQNAFRDAEISALLDTGHFVDRAQNLYDYPNFICDTGGSICEWVDAHDPHDPILKALSDQALLVWIKGSEDHTEELVRRFDRAPKPMAYQPEFLDAIWSEYLREKGVSSAEVNPNDFIRYTYARALAHRQPRYQAMADNWGITVRAKDIAKAQTPEAFDAVIAHALDQAVTRH
ncbi:ATPase [Pacificibacter marinus]|uniref:ATPase n=1 Tax=Pacificibacter marinus TaxID=658057 RepID=A0A1Y5SUS8_9RHOB|nr:ATPase [Pacificibacter marinus]SEK83349.1 hypothetical protein SAMN04488032_10736 [Pacificibacter marinus]SLN48339.1 hypothetical protein PAM7971_02357 [Pacificibacter marinus]